MLLKTSITSGLCAVAGLVLAVSTPVAGASADASKSPQFQTLPPLREQAEIVDGWTKKRKSLIPGILRKYHVDAWLVRLILSPAVVSSVQGSTVRRHLLKTG